MANRFYANRMAIKAISEKEGVDVDIASRMYAQQQGWTGWGKGKGEREWLGKGNGRME